MGKEAWGPSKEQDPLNLRAWLFSTELSENEVKTKPTVKISTSFVFDWRFHTKEVEIKMAKNSIAFPLKHFFSHFIKQKWKVGREKEKQIQTTPWNWREGAHLACRYPQVSLRRPSPAELHPNRLLGGNRYRDHHPRQQGSPHHSSWHHRPPRPRLGHWVPRMRRNQGHQDDRESSSSTSTDFSRRF